MKENKVIAIIYTKIGFQHANLNEVYTFVIIVANRSHSPSLSKQGITINFLDLVN